MSDRLHVGGPVFQLLGRLGLEPSDVAELVVTPTHVTAVCYRKRVDGKKFVDVTGEPATLVREFEVTTWP